MKYEVNIPSRIAEALLRRLLPERGRNDLLGDHAEVYREIAGRRGRFMADLWYWMQIMNLMPRSMWNSHPSPAACQSATDGISSGYWVTVLGSANLRVGIWS